MAKLLGSSNSILVIRLRNAAYSLDNIILLLPCTDEPSPPASGIAMNCIPQPNWKKTTELRVSDEVEGTAEGRKEGRTNDLQHHRP